MRNRYAGGFIERKVKMADNLDDIESRVKMADNLGPMAWLFLPENEQVQYLQKIALRAENPSGP